MVATGIEVTENRIPLCCENEIYSRGNLIEGETLGEHGRLGFVVCFPAEVWRGKLVPERWVHGSAPVPDDFVERFAARKTYIGQFELEFELMAAVCVYCSLPELAGRAVLHCCG